MSQQFIDLNDEVHKQKVSAFKDHIASMSTIATTIGGFEAELRAAYTGPETEIFGRKIQEWVTNYNTVKGKFDEVVNQLGVTNNNVNNMSDNNVNLAMNQDMSPNSFYNGIKG
ncbi:hypothetical protein AB0H34_33660 [Saccharopolyspora shandongensis]|uniref:hypothetical protein n=1 Tax=Saccharopolyspora shandongensis TaxID=418495 RepID=UPI00340E6276